MIGMCELELVKSFRRDRQASVCCDLHRASRKPWKATLASSFDLAEGNRVIGSAHVLEIV